MIQILKEKEGIIETKGDVENGENEISIDEDRIDVPEPSGNIPTEEVQTTAGDKELEKHLYHQKQEGRRRNTERLTVQGREVLTGRGWENDNARRCDDTTEERDKQSQKTNQKDVSAF